MEGRAGFKECPRCGLRNKRSALKCDFCGFEFADASGEWTDYLDILEKLGKPEDADILDESLTKRIESTIVRAPETSTRAELERLDRELAEKLEGGSEVGGKGEAPPFERETDELRDLISTMVMEEKEIQAVEDTQLEEEPAIAEEHYGGEETESPHVEAAAIDEPSIEIKGQEPKIEEAENEDLMPSFEVVKRPVQHPEPLDESHVVSEWDRTGMIGNLEEELPSISELDTQGEWPFELSEGGEVGSESLVGTQNLESEEGSPEVSLFAMADGMGIRPFVLSLVIGAFVYLASLALGIFVDIDGSLGWTIAVIGAILVVIGSGRLFESFVPKPSK